MARPVGKRFQRFGSWQSASTYPACGHSPGQDGVSRVLVLITISACDRHSRYQVARTPVDCQAISFPPPTDLVSRLRRSVRGRPISIRSPSRRQDCRSHRGVALPTRSGPACSRSPPTRLSASVIRTSATRCAYQILDSAILVVKAAEDRSWFDNAETLDCSMKGGVFGQRSVGSEFVVIAGTWSGSGADALRPGPRHGPGTLAGSSR
jgi:hypothetical protein